MGVKTVLAATVVTAGHQSAALVLGHNVAGLVKHANVKIDEALYSLREIVKSLPGGDPNTAAINAQIAALS